MKPVFNNRLYLINIQKFFIHLNSIRYRYNSLQRVAHPVAFGLHVNLIVGIRFDNNWY